MSFAFKTGGIDEDPAMNPSTWSRGLIVGLSAGLTLVLILSVGMLLLCRYMFSCHQYLDKATIWKHSGGAKVIIEST